MIRRSSHDRPSTRRDLGFPTTRNPIWLRRRLGGRQRARASWLKMGWWASALLVGQYPRRHRARHVMYPSDHRFSHGSWVTPLGGCRVPEILPAPSCLKLGALASVKTSELSPVARTLCAPTAEKCQEAKRA
eukprot:2480442-Prymnesium_polylepis.4